MKIDKKTGKIKRYEKDFQKEVEQLLSYVIPKCKYGWWIHISPEKCDKSNKGIPDIIGWYNINNKELNYDYIQPFYIELKVGHNKPSLYQMQKMNELSKCGAIGCVCYTLEEVKQFLKENLYINIE